MNKWKMTFIFLAGFCLHGFLTHMWIAGEQVLPVTVRLLGTFTPEMNIYAYAGYGLLLLMFGFLTSLPWRRRNVLEGASDVQPSSRSV
jgi:hypothetical protein